VGARSSPLEGATLTLQLRAQGVALSPLNALKGYTRTELPEPQGARLVLSGAEHHRLALAASE
jgi:hypothetical protein